MITDTLWTEYAQQAFINLTGSFIVSVQCFGVLSHGMMTSSNANNFHVTGPLCGEFTGHRDAELWYFLWSAPEQTVHNWDAGDSRRHRAHYDVIVMDPGYGGSNIGGNLDLDTLQYSLMSYRVHCKDSRDLLWAIDNCVYIVLLSVW